MLPHHEDPVLPHYGDQVQPTTGAVIKCKSTIPYMQFGVRSGEELRAPRPEGLEEYLRISGAAIRRGELPQPFPASCHTIEGQSIEAEIRELRRIALVEGMEAGGCADSIEEILRVLVEKGAGVEWYRVAAAELADRKKGGLCIGNFIDTLILSSSPLEFVARALLERFVESEQADKLLRLFPVESRTAGAVSPFRQFLSHHPHNRIAATATLASEIFDQLAQLAGGREQELAAEFNISARSWTAHHNGLEGRLGRVRELVRSARENLRPGPKDSLTETIAAYLLAERKPALAGKVPFAHWVTIVAYAPTISAAKNIREYALRCEQPREFRELIRRAAADAVARTMMLSADPRETNQAFTELLDISRSRKAPGYIDPGRTLARYHRIRQLHEGFSRYTYAARRAPGDEHCELVAYGSAAGEVRYLNTGKNRDQYPGPGFIIANLDPARIFAEQPDGPLWARGMREYLRALPGRGEYLDALAKAEFLFCRGAIAITVRDDQRFARVSESGRWVLPVTTVIHNDHFTNPRNRVAHLLPTEELDLALRDATFSATASVSSSARQIHTTISSPEFFLLGRAARGTGVDIGDAEAIGKGYRYVHDQSEIGNIVRGSLALLDLALLGFARYHKGQAAFQADPAGRSRVPDLMLERVLRWHLHEGSTHSHNNRPVLAIVDAWRQAEPPLEKRWIDPSTLTAHGPWGERTLSLALPERDRTFFREEFLAHAEDKRGTICDLAFIPRHQMELIDA